MREAFSLLIDRDYIVENVGQSGQVPANSFIPLGMADGNGGVFKSSVEDEGYFDVYGINNDYEGTLEKAASEAAGYKFGDDGMLSDETPITVEYLTNNGSTHIAIAEAMQQDLAALGIEMTIPVSGLERLPRGAQERQLWMTSAVKAGSPTSTTPSTCLRCGSPTPATTTASIAALANM